MALLDHYVDRYADRLDRMLTRPGSAHQRLMRYWNAWIADPDKPASEGWAEGCLVVKLSAEVADLSEDMRLVLAAGVERLINRIAGLILDGRADGSLPVGADAPALAQALYQMWLGAALLSKLIRSQAPMHQALLATEQLLACTTHANEKRPS